MQAHTCLPSTIWLDKRVSDTAIRILGHLASIAEVGAWQSPQQAAVATALGVTRETVNRAMKKLADAGYIERRDLKASGRGKVGCEYRVAVDHIGKKADVSEESQRRNSNDLPMCAQDHNGEADVTHGSQPMCAGDHIGPEVEDAQYTEIAPMCAQDHSKKAEVIGASQQDESAPHTPLEINTNLGDISNPLTPKTDRKRRSRTVAPCSAFDEAWAVWPRRDRSSKAKSAAAWAAAAGNAAPAAMLNAVIDFAAAEIAKGNGAQYVPAMERWLRDRLPSWLEAQSEPQPSFTANGAAILEPSNVQRFDRNDRAGNRGFRTEDRGCGPRSTHNADIFGWIEHSTRTAV